MGRWTVTNPITAQEIDGERSKKIRALRKARVKARRAARSGNPAKRAEAQRALDMIPGLIRNEYVEDYKEKSTL